MMKRKRIIYTVQCPYDPSHLFEKAFDYMEGQGDEQTNSEAYCPFCDSMVQVTRKERFGESNSLVRSFEILR